MGDMINKVGTGSVNQFQSKAKEVKTRAQNELNLIETHDVYTPQAKEAETKSAPKKTNIQKAKELIHNALKGIDAAKPDLKKAEKDAEEGREFLDAMDNHIKKINLDFLSDVSGEGGAVRRKGENVNKESDEGVENVKNAGADVAQVKKDIDGALKLLNGDAEKKKNKNASYAASQLKQAQYYMGNAEKDVEVAEKRFGFGKGKVNEMKPFLDIIEQDTVELDVGRFARDLKELQGKADEHLLEAGILSEFTGKDLDNVSEYLNKALKYLK